MYVERISTAIHQELVIFKTVSFSSLIKVELTKAREQLYNAIIRLTVNLRFLQNNYQTLTAKKDVKKLKSAVSVEKETYIKLANIIELSSLKGKYKQLRKCNSSKKFRYNCSLELSQLFAK